jgi:hypothetical protein
MEALVSWLVPAGVAIAVLIREGMALWQEHKDGAINVSMGEVVWVMLVVLWIGLFLGASANPALWPVTIGLLVFVFPWTVTRRVLVPLGMWRSAYVIGFCARVRWSASPAGGAVGAAWALARKGGGSERARDWVERRCRRARRPDAGHVLALGLLRDAAGDRHAARQLIESVLDFDPTVWGLANRLATEWLAAAAAEDGDWARILELDELPGPRSRAFALLAAMARRIEEGERYPSDFELRWRWLLAPGRRRTRPIVDAVIGGWAPPPRAATRPISAPVDTSPLAAAIHAHAALSVRPPSQVTGFEIDQVGEAWDAALCSEYTEEWLLRRGATLMARDVDSVMAELARDVERSLAALVRSGNCSLELDDIESEAAFDAVHAERSSLLGELTLISERLENIAEDATGKELDIWQQWAAVRARYNQVIARGGVGLRRAAFVEVHHPLCSLAVDLWRQNRLRPLANAIFRWLLEEAIEVEDFEAMELQRKNVEAGI